MIPLRPWTAAVSLLFAVGCGREFFGADPEPEAPEPVVAVAEAAPPAPVDPLRDARGRLAVADGLVNGFEVPKGLRLVKRQKGYLEFQLEAPIEALTEFYSGIDNGTGRRFTERQYLVEDNELGFDVHHTGASLERLHLDERYREGYLFVSSERPRVQRVRVHLAPPPPAPDDDPFMPRVAAGPGSDSPPQGPAPRHAEPLEPIPGGGAGAGARGASQPPSTSGGARGDGPSGRAGTGATGGSDRTSAPPAEPGSASTGGGGGGAGSLPGLSPTQWNNAATLRPQLNGPQNGAKRYGPYASPGRSVVRDIQRWQLTHPGESFID